LSLVEKYFGGPLLLHPRQDIAVRGVPQAGSKEAWLKREEERSYFWHANVRTRGQLAIL